MIYYPPPQLHGSQGSPLKDTMNSSASLSRTAGLDQSLQSPMKPLSRRVASTGWLPFQGTCHPHALVTVRATEGVKVERKVSTLTEDLPSPLASSASLSSSSADTSMNRRQLSKSSERFEKLYDDHRNRQKRLIALVRAKQACEDAELAQMQRTTADPSKTLDLSRFRAELDEQLRSRERRRRRREEEKRRAARNREVEELAQCSFRPMKSTDFRKALGGHSQSVDRASSRGDSSVPTECGTEAEEFFSSESPSPVAHEREEQPPTNTADFSRKAARDFLRSPLGRGALLRHLEAYRDLNPIADEKVLMREAERDLIAHFEREFDKTSTESLGCCPTEESVIGAADEHDESQFSMD
ncbi:hypothetical protein FOZ60_010785 [Perkinsus olseni]|uniref:Uncharacterized protein n=1 Tax=Perkinsus olseni TaxID=32597 RepID=A0A7J6NEF5_PEROL|nr:hypothetical protein FOZ60_010785 [Perkinsus olseni]